MSAASLADLGVVEPDVSDQLGPAALARLREGVGLVVGVAVGVALTSRRRTRRRACRWIDSKDGTRRGGGVRPADGPVDLAGALRRWTRRAVRHVRPALGFLPREDDRRPSPDPTEALPDRGRERAVGVEAALITVLDVWDEVREELHAGPQLVVAPETGVVGALVEDEAGVEVGQPSLGDRRPREVLQERSERGVITGGDGALGVDRETGVLPRAQEGGAVVVDGVASPKGVEDRVAEGELEGAKAGGGFVDGDRMEDAVWVEDAGGDEGVDVGMEGEQRTEALRCGDEGGDRAVELGEARGEVELNP